MDITLEVVDTKPPEPEVLLESAPGSNVCPFAVALHVVGSALTPKKLASYQQKFQDDTGHISVPLYITWSYLKGQILGNEFNTSNSAENPLVKVGVVSMDLGDIFTPL